jgi:uncharacterized membrane protein YoaK (UPF0700 family)
MINKLPKWVEIGGFFLALCAGSINAIGLLGFKHQAVSHLTGTSTFLALEIAHNNTAEIVHLLLVIASFVGGAAFSGVLIGNTALQLGRRYSFALIIESILLLLSMLYLNLNSSSGHFFASAACGLQNAMTSTYSGAVVRTTHVSGLFTDLGVILGLKLRGIPIDKRRVVLYLTLITGFVTGGIIGAIGFDRWHFSAMLIPAALSAFLALSYWIYWRTTNAQGVN